MEFQRYRQTEKKIDGQKYERDKVTDRHPAMVAWCDYSSCFSFSKFVLWSHGGLNHACGMQYELILNKKELMLHVDAIGL